MKGNIYFFKFLLRNISFSFLKLVLIIALFSAKLGYAGVELNVENNDSLNIKKGIESFKTYDFNLEIIKSSHTVFGLHPISEPEFDFTPGEWLPQRNKAGFYHLGDINFRVKSKGESEWKSFSSAASRKAIIALQTENENQFAVSDLSPVLDNSPVKVTRFWEKDGGNIVLRFKIENITGQPIEIGSLGIPLIFNNNHSQKSLDEAHAENVFYDPYIGMDAGYLQVVRLKGTGSVLLVTPYGKTPFEAWNPLLDDPTRRGITFEGFHEWMPLTKAFAENEWKEAEPWNKPSSKILKPGKSVVFGLQFSLAESIREIENTLIENNRPVAVGVPGYVLPQDVNGVLFLKYSKNIKKLLVEPEGALTLEKNGTTEHGWKKYSVKANTWGRARLTVVYSDGNQQTINYKIIKPESQVIADNGHFLTTKQWFGNENDIFGRGPSVITYDYEKQQQVVQDSRAWICGLSDEGGAGSWLNAVMKELIQPNKEEVAKLEDFVQKTIWGGIQYNEGKLKYGVRKSMFYYEPDSLPQGIYDKDVRWGKYGGFPSWDKKQAMSVGRSYNYPHVAAAHWVMYRLARNYEGLVMQQDWFWYLEKAYQTSMAMVELAPYYAQFGQMEGSVFVHILKDLQAEGFWEYARKLEEKMKNRTKHWSSLSYPFGSEMPWDSTGQEEVYMWSNFFGFDDKAETTLNAILAYMPTIPHWAYNGNARRYWDFLYGGKLSRIERQIHHYGSALNAIPVLHQYKYTPDDFYLLRVGYGGLLGAISNITKDGFAPAAFHSFPSTLKNDGISGDYGPGFYGYAVNTSSYLVHHKEFGWLAFGGNIEEVGEEIQIQLTTAAKSAIFIEPLKLWLTLDAGSFNKVLYNPESGKLKIELEKANDFTPKALLRVETTGESAFKLNSGWFTINKRGQFEIPLENVPLEINLN